MKKKYIIFLAAALFVIINTSFAQPTLVWDVRYPDTTSFGAEANSCVIDSAGNIYVGGYAGTPSWMAYCTIKYNSSGVRQWAAMYNTGLNG